MHKNATVSEWYRKHGKHEIYAKGKKVSLQEYTHSLYVDSQDAARVREKTSDVPMTASEEEKARRRAAWEAQQARQLYEELVLKKPAPKFIQIGDANLNGKGNDNGESRPDAVTDKVSA